jgi:iron complex outermembrane receptor protein
MTCKLFSNNSHFKTLTVLAVSLFHLKSYGLEAEPTTQVSSGIEEVMVTARKRSESSLDVPIAMSLFGENTLSSPLIENIASLGSLSPNVDFNTTAPFSGSSNAASVFIRGIGQNDFLLTTDPGVGIYLDGVYVARSIGGVLQVAEAERVEILRGPQGTLFGKNTIGGAIQVITRKPSSETQGHVTLTAGNFDRQDLKASIEGSLNETVQARLSVLSEKRDGYVDRLLDDIELGNINRQTYNAKLAWQINDNTDFDLSVDHTHQRQESIAQTIIEMVPTAISTAYNIFVADPNLLWDERWVTNDPYSTYQTGPSQDDADVTGASVTINHYWDNVDLTSITGYRRMSADYARDIDNSPLQYGHSTNHDTHKQFSQELRLTGNAFNEKLDWLAGAYYFREHGINVTEGFLFSGLYQVLGDPAYDLDFVVNNDIITDSRAFFTQVTSHITDQLNLTLGLRHSKEDKTFFVDNYTINAGVQFVGPTTEKASWTNSSPMLSVDYHINDDTMTYFTVSEGFKSGSFNGRQIFFGPVDQFDPEFATSYELGLKTRIQSINAKFEAAIFSVDYKDMQFSTIVGTDFGLLPYVDNAAKAEIDGIELSINHKTATGFAYDAGIGYIDAHYTDVSDTVLITGDEDLLRTPQWNAHLQLSYQWLLANAGSMTLATTANYKSKIYNDTVNTESIAQDDLTLLNASLGWISPSEKWTVEAFIINLTDEVYLLSGSTDVVAFGGTEGHYARPREGGIKVALAF